MKEVILHGAQPAAQLTVAVDGGDPPSQVIIGLEGAAGSRHGHHWLLHNCDPVMARDIADQLITGALLIEGKLSPEDMPPGKLSTNAETEGFHEHD